MTKGERKKAIALALTRMEEAETTLNEAYAKLREFERTDKTRYVCDSFIMAAYAPYKQHIRECQDEWHKARLEYAELTKYKAWRNL